MLGGTADLLERSPGATVVIEWLPLRCEVRVALLEDLPALMEANGIRGIVAIAVWNGGAC